MSSNAAKPAVHSKRLGVAIIEADGGQWNEPWPASVDGHPLMKEICMSNSLVHTLGTIALSFGLVFAAADLASAKGGPKGAGGQGFGKAHGMAPGFNKGQRVGWQGTSRPPGWSHGRKTGWRGGTMPPGLR
jgi:hypothetical protein